MRRWRGLSSASTRNGSTCEATLSSTTTTGSVARAASSAAAGGDAAAAVAAAAAAGEVLIVRRREGGRPRVSGGGEEREGSCRGRTTTRLSPLRVPIPKRGGGEAVPVYPRRGERGSQRQHGSGFFNAARPRAARDLRCRTQRMR